MFTGLVHECGRVEQLVPVDSGGVRIEISHSEDLSSRLELGASLAIAGTCLTVIDGKPGLTWLEMSPETLERTTLDRLEIGTSVNLEPALRMGDPLGGHWVQGHVDTTTVVVSRQDLGVTDADLANSEPADSEPADSELAEHRVVGFALPKGLELSFVQKGSVTVDGVSLTVSKLLDNEFQVALIPHTLEVTTLGNLEVNDKVNIEVDVLSKYVQRALEGHLAARSAGPSDSSS